MLRRPSTSVTAWAKGAALALVATTGITAAAAQNQPDDIGVERGAMLFQSVGCAGCHGADAGGDFGPRLTPGKNIDAATIVPQVLRGGGGMPGFSLSLSDTYIAAITNFIRIGLNRLDGETTAADVAAYRNS